MRGDASGVRVGGQGLANRVLVAGGGGGSWGGGGSYYGNAMNASTQVGLQAGNGQIKISW